MRFGSPADGHGRVVALFVALGSFLFALRSRARRDFGKRDEIRTHLIRRLDTSCKMKRLVLDSISRCLEVGQIDEHVGIPSSF